jgi:hypothetical protein
MPTITPATDWFTRKRARTSADPKAAYRRLVRMLAGDAERRTRAPVTLPGRYAGYEHDIAPAAEHEAAPPTAPKPRRTGHGYASRAMRNDVEALPEDGARPYSRKDLLRMDGRFQARLQRAIKRGLESSAAAAHRVASPLW